MSVRTDTVNLIVNVNGNAAQNALNDLRKKAADVTLEMGNLRKGTAEYIAKKKELSDVAKAMADLKQQIGLTALTQKELNSELNKLKALKGSVVPFTKEFHDLQVQIEAVEARLYDVRNGVQGFASFFSKISDSVKQFGVMAAGYLGFQFITSQFTSILSGAGKLSDQLADLRRVAGLTADEAAILNTALGKIDTRTSVSSLRDIAIVAGKLGVAKGEILGFVEATDKLVVALGDELGDSDQITTQLGKILNVFDGKVTGETITKLGNAIVVLANAGVATGGFISDFTQRVAGIAKASNLSLGATAGLAAGFEELGLRSESSATALQKLLSTIAADLPKAAKIAGATSVAEIQKYTDLFATSPEKALIQYAEGLTKNKSSFAEITASFKDAGEEGARIVQTLQAIGQRGEFLQSKIDLGAQSIKESTAITEAFDLKNQTLGATMDKLGKDFAKFASSGAMKGFLVGAVNGLRDFFAAVKELPKFISDNIIAFGAFAFALILYNKALISSTLNLIGETIAEVENAIATRVSAIATSMATAAKEIYAAAVALVTKEITLAVAAQRIWAAVVTLGLGPISIIIIAVGLLANAFYKMVTEIVKASAAQKALQDINEKASEKTSDEISKIQFLTSVIKDKTLSDETQAAALKELIALNPQYLGGLTKNNIALKEGKDIIDKYIETLNLKASVEATQEIRTANAKKDLALRNRQDELERKSIGFKEDIKNDRYGDGTESLIINNRIIEDIKKERAALKELNDQNDIYSKQFLNKQTPAASTPGVVAAPKGPSPETIESLKAKIKDLNTSYETIDITEKGLMRKNRAEKDKLQAQLDAIEGKKSKADKKSESEYERTLKEAQKFAEELRKLKLKIQAGELGEGQKEVQLVNDKYAELIKKATDFHEKLKTNSSTFHQQELLIEGIHQDELLELYKKQFTKKAALEYADTQKNSEEYFAEERNRLGHKYADGVIDKKQYEAALKTTETQETDNRLIIAKNYADNVKKAAEDVKTFTKKQQDEITKNLVAETDKRNEAAQKEADASLKLALLKAKPGSNIELELKKRELAAKFLLETKGMEATSAMYRLAYEQLNKDIAALNSTSAQAKVDEALGVANKILGFAQTLATAIGSLENASVQKDAQSNDKKKKAMALQVKNKLLSQQQYEVQSAILDLQTETREKKSARDQAKRNKEIAVVQAIISTAMGVAAALSAQPFGPWNFVEAAVVGVLGGIQIAAIANQPLPALGSGGWITEGDKHSDASGGINAKIERDEAVMAANAMTSKEKYTVTGTTAQITSALNKAGGGADWSGGADMYKPVWRSQKPATINANMPRIMEQGGIVRPIAPTANAGAAPVDLAPVTAEIKALRDDVAGWNTKLQAVFTYKQYDDGRLPYDLAKKAGGMSQ